MTEENKALDNSEITYTTNPNISSESKETVTPKPEEVPVEINQEQQVCCGRKSDFQD